jgi:hypothetical protein
VVPSALAGTNDNSLGAVAASSPDDVWAVGNFLPDTADSNQDATLSLANHFDGTTWSAVPTPNAGPNFDTFFGVAASGGKAWAVGVHLDAAFEDRALVEAWDGTKWSLVTVPQPGPFVNVAVPASAGSIFTSLWAVTESQGTVWAVGTFEDVVSTNNEPLILRGNGDKFTVVNGPTPNGRAGSDIIGGVAATGDTVWAVGTYDTGDNRLTLTQRRRQP